MKLGHETYIAAPIGEGFECDEFEGKGLLGLSGKLTFQPEYQRVKPRGICCG